jgi:hypothetical protein
VRLGQTDPDNLLATADLRDPDRGDLRSGISGKELRDQRTGYLEVGDIEVTASELLGDDP